MLIFDYTNDLGLTTHFVKPTIIGYSLSDSQPLDHSSILSILSAFIPVTEYKIVEKHHGVCQVQGRMRRIRVETHYVVIEAEYYRPFDLINWGIVQTLDYRVETIPEFLNDSVLTLVRRKLNG